LCVQSKPGLLALAARPEASFIFGFVISANSLPGKKMFESDFWPFFWEQANEVINRKRKKVFRMESNG
jgi:hypothetical protein